MADKLDTESASDPRQGRPPEEFPSSTFPAVFVDLIWSATHSAEVVKLYLGRVDPNIYGRGGAVPTPILQIVMPITGFVASAAFLQQKLQVMIEQGVITQQQVDDANKVATTAASLSPSTTDTPEADDNAR
ncbi:hypothetical protein HUN39_15625 [Methylocystis sp. FS]|uniref:hypothetical protein n=1 Tax=Methylocystis silviterrae TaxID=2743612 RepID=UPI001583E9CC|nr:hypothetical protein [Methylocystis silviterrae]NUJ81428.1 hypothetical protein [Methylocystis silviterrae]